MTEVPAIRSETAPSREQRAAIAAADTLHPDEFSFADAERGLKAYLMALWRLHPVLRGATRPAGQPMPRRVSFDGGYVRIADLQADAHADQRGSIYWAALAHVAAHLSFTPGRSPIGTLKPLQIALVSLIEDARVEALAIREYPGLHRLWAAYHTAQPGSAASAEILMARLSRALIDPAYRDDDPWVQKGRTMFFDHRVQWDQPAISRHIGGLLGNDLGQMRIQFNAKTYVVEPAYRDDNAGLWDWEDAPPQQADDSDVPIESFRMVQQQDEGQSANSRRRDETAGSAVPARERPIGADAGIPVARYAEWDYVLGRARPDWTMVLEFEAPRASTVGLERLLHDYADVESRIIKLIRSARVARPVRMRRRAEGERLDLESCIRAAIDCRLGVSPDPRVYETSEMRDRDLAVLVLLDISESTKEFVKSTTTTVLSMERAATALLAAAMEALDDPFAIHAFCSNGRSEVRYYRVKDFHQPYGSLASERLAGLRGGLSTRIGAALRHARSEMRTQPFHRRLLLVVTDGEPSDIDVQDRKYLVEDARRAVQELGHEGIDVFCVGLDSGGDSYLTRIFGRRNAVQIDQITALPEKLPAIYLRLTT
jgi:nitric oxide reductase NorD protein